MEEREIRLLNIFKGETLNLQKIKVKKGVGDYGWNKHLLAPLKNGEEVFIHPSQEGVAEKYIRIIHSQYKCISIFSKVHFEF